MSEGEPINILPILQDLASKNRRGFRIDASTDLTKLIQGMDTNGESPRVTIPAPYEKLINKGGTLYIDYAGGITRQCLIQETSEK